MATATDETTGLAYDAEGTGVPVVFLHGLTFQAGNNEVAK